MILKINQDKIMNTLGLHIFQAGYGWFLVHLPSPFTP